jgi:threonine dehydrogenase-like Zn-dependent dehydrogenase
MQVVQVAEPVPTTDQPILLRMRSGGICGSDLHTYRGLHPFRRPPVVLGHEGAGVVESVPAGERRISVGDRVAVMPVLSCWDCARCETGISHLCAHKRVPGSGWPGLLSEYVTAPARVLIPLHDGIDLSEGAMIEPVAVAWHAARSAGITAGESVAVLGAGPIGSLVARVCQLHHVRTLLASDAKEYNVQFLRRLGISDAINVTRDDVVAAGRDLTGDAGFDAVVIASGHPTGMAEALALCRPRGRIVVLPMFGGALSVDLNPLVLKEVSVAGSTIYRPDDFAAAARLVNTRELDVRPFITEVVPLAESPAALQAIDAGADHVKIQIDLTR